MRGGSKTQPLVVKINFHDSLNMRTFLQCSPCHYEYASRYIIKALNEHLHVLQYRLSLNDIAVCLIRGITVSNKRVKDYMRDISKITVTTDMKMADVLSIMLQTGTPAIVVTDVNHQLQGVITTTDVTFEMARQIDSSKLHNEVEHLLTDEPIWVTEDMLMLDALDKMVRRTVRTLVVTRGFVPVGILTQWDVIGWWSEQYGLKQ